MRAALIPMKELSQAKMRLADVLERRQRAELALAMLTDVITACHDSGCFDMVAVCSSDSEVFWHARELGAKPIAEPATLQRPAGVQALNEGLTFAQRYLARRIAVDELVILPADIPLVRFEDVGAVVAELQANDEPRAVIVRARDNGTNALALRPPEAISMQFGRNSADAHRAGAEAASLEVIELPLERIEFDVDAPEDLDALATLPAGAATRGWLEAHAHYARSQ
jgi:2-phospho-L-lactate guanylyltransferase